MAHSAGRHTSTTNIQNVAHCSFKVKYATNTPLYSSNVTSYTNPLRVTLIQKWLIFNDILEKDTFSQVNVVADLLHEQCIQRSVRTELQFSCTASSSVSTATTIAVTVLQTLKNRHYLLNFHVFHVGDLQFPKHNINNIHFATHSTIIIPPPPIHSWPLPIHLTLRWPHAQSNSSGSPNQPLCLWTVFMRLSEQTISSLQALKLLMVTLMTVQVHDSSGTFRYLDTTLTAQKTFCPVDVVPMSFNSKRH